MDNNYNASFNNSSITIGNIQETNCSIDYIINENNILRNEIKSLQDNMQCIIYDVQDRLECIERKFEEENKMLESERIINLVFKEREDLIRKHYDKLIKNAEDNDSVIKEYTEFINKFREDGKTLFNKYDELTKDKEGVINPIISNDCEILKYQLSINYIPEEVKLLLNEKEEISKELNKEKDLVRAATSIAQSKDEIEEILVRYNVLDKNKKAILTYDFKKNKNK